MNHSFCNIMIKQYGSLFNNLNGKYGWCLLGHIYRLSVDVLQLCLGYSPIPTIKLEMTVDDNSFKYIFKTELDGVICSIRRTLVDNSSRDKAETSYYNKRWGRDLIVALLLFVNRKTLVEVIIDYLSELKITNKESCCIASMYFEAEFYYYNITTPQLRRYPSPFGRNLTNYNVNTNHLGNILQCNTNWDLITTLGVNPKVALVNSNYKLNLYTDEDGVTKWVCIRELTVAKGNITDKLKFGFRKGIDYKYKKDIKFEDPETIDKKFKCKNTYFINLKSLVNYLTIYGSVQSKVLAVWILMNSLEDNNYHI